MTNSSTQEVAESTSFVRPSSVVDELVTVIRQEIARGSLGSGRLRINRLAERFGVSVVPVREALRRLQAEGLITFNLNREVRVVAPSEKEVGEIFLMRSLLEPVLLEAAMPRLRLTAPEWQTIVTAFEGMHNVELGSAEWLELNARFHQTMYAAAQLPTVLRIVETLWTSSNAVLVAYGQSKDAVAVAQEEHRELVELIEQQDPTGAAQLLRRHLARTLEECQRLMRARHRGEEELDG